MVALRGVVGSQKTKVRIRKRGVRMLSNKESIMKGGICKGRMGTLK